jgi:hypothetical protein
MIKRLEYYVLIDHKARWINDSAAFGLALFWWAVRVFFLNATDERAFVESLILAVCWVGFTTLAYCWSPRKELQKVKTKSSPVKFSSQPLIPRLAMISLATILIASIGLSLPTVEAKILDSRLKSTLTEPLTQDTISKAQEIVQSAQQYNLNANPALISQLGKKILDYTAKNPELAGPGLQAASAFASYRSAFVILATGGEVEVDNPVTGFDVAMRGINPNSENPAFWKRPDGSLLSNKPKFQRIVFRVVHERGAFPLDNQEFRNITYINMNILYSGGPVKLESTQFIQCHFLIPSVNDNTQKLIAAALGGEPVTLELK